MSEPSRKLSSEEVTALMDGLKSGDLGASTVVGDSKDIEFKKNQLVSKKIIKKKKEEKTKNTGSKFFSYLIVFIISLIALMILLDTLKSPLIDIFPDLEFVLFSLFETLKDIKLFIIDLY